ncbi:MAG TPA: maleylpyruvate isomerase N-terminal domain-containing protein, partial [Acidimicrobiales bacterium]|nr:maleylpyruvate isomerase N-terminal domain-containing protein [Acidimicrobiales bacterium]
MSRDTYPAVDAFLDATRHAGQVLTSPEVGAAWTRDSALPRMTVGTVAGHLFLVVRRVDKHLDEPEHVVTGVDAIERYRWLRVERPEDLDRTDHCIVRADGDRVAAWGWSAVATAYNERARKLNVRLAARCPTSVVLETGVMDFQSYLVTRVVELLVHGDDLATSVGISSVAP